MFKMFCQLWHCQTFRLSFCPMFGWIQRLVYLIFLTRLTLLIHTSVLPSNWNLSKFFAPIGQLGQAHMVKECFWNPSMREPFSVNSFYLLVLRKITNSVTKTTIFPHGGKSEIFFLPYVLDLIDMLEQKFCQDSNVRVKLMNESVK